MADYAGHSLWSDPGSHVDRMAELPDEPLALADALENFLIHHAAAHYLGFGVPDYAESDRTLRRMDLLLDTMLERDGRTLAAHRDLPHYLYGTCHDFALFAVAAMRTRGIEARIRAGYVDYHAKGRWEDHWVCEYRAGGEWRLLDAQMGRRAREGFGIKFAIDDVPRDRFRSGAQVWQAIRSGSLDAEICGVSFAGISGEWFPATSVLRDAAALCCIETLPWDYWGPARNIAAIQSVTPEIARMIDALAQATHAAPDSLGAAKEMLDAHSWARPGDTVLSILRTGPAEQPIAGGAPV